MKLSLSKLREINQLANQTILTLIGERTLLINVYERVTYLTKARIVIQLSTCFLTIDGTELAVLELTNDRLEVIGYIKSMSFKEGDPIE